MKRIFTLAVLAATLVLTGIWYTDATESYQETTVDVSENGEAIKESSFTEKALDPYRTDSLVGITFEVPADWYRRLNQRISQQTSTIIRSLSAILTHIMSMCSMCRWKT